jgi:hypothetical protein
MSYLKRNNDRKIIAHICEVHISLLSLGKDNELVYTSIALFCPMSTLVSTDRLAGLWTVPGAFVRPHSLKRSSQGLTVPTLPSPTAQWACSNYAGEGLRERALTSGPWPLTWNLGKLNPAKGRVMETALRGEGQARELCRKEGKNTKRQK